MHIKRFWTVFAILLVILCGLGLVACDGKEGDDEEQDSHAHTYNTVWSMNEKYHWHAATCSHATQTSDKAEHTFDGMACKVCGCVSNVPSQGLSFALNEEASAYTVTGMGECTDTNLILPSTYNGLPVTAIHSYAFLGCSKILRVLIPESITEIGQNAFLGANRLTEVCNLSALNINVGSSAYGGIAAHALWVSNTAAEISRFVVTQDEYLFYDTGNAAHLIAYLGQEPQLVLPDSYQGKTYYIQDYALSQYGFLQSVTLPDFMDVVPIGLLSDCGALVRVMLPDGVTTIGESAFSGCSALSEIVLPDSVNSIGTGAFSDCKSLVELHLPDSVSIIAKETFENCSSLARLSIPDGVTSIGWSAFSGCSSLTEIVLPDSVNSIHTSAFMDCTSLVTISIPDGVRSIGEGAFSRCSSLTEIVLPPGITTIEFAVFSGCSALQRVTIPDGVTAIKSGAFSSCYSLTEIALPDSLTQVDVNAFMGNINLQTIAVSSQNTVFTSEGGALYSKDKTVLLAYPGAAGSVEIPEGVTRIASMALLGARLSSITIPASMETIEEDAFWQCAQLLEVYNLSSLDIIAGNSGNGGVAAQAKHVYTSSDVPSSLTTTPDGYRFYADGDTVYLMGYLGEKATQLDLPANFAGKPYAIYARAFWCNPWLERVVIPEGVTEIGDGAFAYCSVLTEITIPASVTHIGEDVFWECSALRGIQLPDALIKIGNRAFQGCTALCEITLPASMTDIGNSLFNGCKSLNRITISPNLQYIDRDMFAGCSSLTDIDFCGTQAQWDEIIKDKNWDADMVACTVHCIDGQIEI